MAEKKILSDLTVEGEIRATNYYGTAHSVHVSNEGGGSASLTLDSSIRSVIRFCNEGDPNTATSQGTLFQIALESPTSGPGPIGSTRSLAIFAFTGGDTSPVERVLWIDRVEALARRPSVKFEAPIIVKGLVQGVWQSYAATYSVGGTVTAQWMAVGETIWVNATITSPAGRGNLSLPRTVAADGGFGGVFGHHAHQGVGNYPLRVVAGNNSTVADMLSIGGTPAGANHQFQATFCYKALF